MASPDPSPRLGSLLPGSLRRRSGLWLQELSRICPGSGVQEAGDPKWPNCPPDYHPPQLLGVRPRQVFLLLFFCGEAFFCEFPGFGSASICVPVSEESDAMEPGVFRGPRRSGSPRDFVGCLSLCVKVRTPPPKKMVVFLVGSLQMG